MPPQQQPTFAVPAAEAASHTSSMATAAAISSLSALPGITRVQQDKRVYLLHGSQQWLEGGHPMKARHHSEQREQKQQHRRLEALQPHSTCPSLYRAVGNGSQEYIPYGVAAVQALDPVIIEASKNISSRVGSKGLLLPILQAAAAGPPISCLEGSRCCKRVSTSCG
jgi:hypothetical protein